MKLLIIRHGDPDYTIDSLTTKGWKEAEMLSERISKLDVKAFYCSPLGRAIDTSKYTLEKSGKKAVICDWLQEFPAYVINPKNEEKVIPWDMLPSYWTKNDSFYDRKLWNKTPYMQSGNVDEKYKDVCNGIDELLCNHGYKHENDVYKVEHSNNDTVVLFCHFGVECVILSYILGISPVVLWQSFIALPTSVTTLVTEEREEGIARFRCMSFGDLSHLYCCDEPASFSGRFCETFDNQEERH